jgi:hypothetical protein
VLGAGLALRHSSAGHDGLFKPGHLQAPFKFQTAR